MIARYRPKNEETIRKAKKIITENRLTVMPEIFSNANRMISLGIIVNTENKDNVALETAFIEGINIITCCSIGQFKKCMEAFRSSMVRCSCGSIFHLDIKDVTCPNCETNPIGFLGYDYENYYGKKKNG